MAVFSAVFAWTVSRLAGAVGRDSGRDGPAGATVACGLPNGAVELGPVCSARSVNSSRAGREKSPPLLHRQYERRGQHAHSSGHSRLKAEAERPFRWAVTCGCSQVRRCSGGRSCPMMQEGASCTARELEAATSGIKQPTASCTAPRPRVRRGMSPSSLVPLTQSLQRRRTRTPAIAAGRARPYRPDTPDRPDMPTGRRPGRLGALRPGCAWYGRLPAPVQRQSLRQSHSQTPQPARAHGRPLRLRRRVRELNALSRQAWRSTVFPTSQSPRRTSCRRVHRGPSPPDQHVLPAWPPL